MSQPNTPAPTAPDIAGTAQDPTNSSISAAAKAYQTAMQQQPSISTPPPGYAPPASVTDSIKDVVMTEGAPDRPAVSFRGQ